MAEDASLRRTKPISDAIMPNRGASIKTHSPIRRRATLDAIPSIGSPIPRIRRHEERITPIVNMYAAKVSGFNCFLPFISIPQLLL